MIRKADTRFAETVLDDEVVLMNVDTGEFFSLVGTGRAIWSLIDGKRDRIAIRDELLEIFEVEPEQCSSDVDAFIDLLVDGGFVERG